MTLQDMCREYKIRFKKQLGQNLLLDDNINRIMVEAAGLNDSIDVVEVGAGLGALTARLHEPARRVLSIEIDRSFMQCLEDQFDSIENVTLLRADALNHEVHKLVEEHLPGATTLHLVSNLPYYITTPLLFHFWEAKVFFARMVVMVQAEVGERLTAPVNTANYGALALAAQLRSEVDIVHRVPASCFRPKPKVDSVIVRFRNREEPLYPDIPINYLMGIVRSAFAQRRKTLRNSLAKSGQLGIPAEAVVAAMESCGVDPSRRPQTLTLDEFAAIARACRSYRAEGVKNE